MTGRLQKICLVAGIVWLPAIAPAQSYNMSTVAGTTRLVEGKQATAVPLRSPWGVAQDPSGTIYIADQRDNRILRVAPDGTLTTLAGRGEPGFSGDNGPAVKARMDTPRALRLDGKGGLYFSDWMNHRVRKVDLTTGIITTVAGNGNVRYSGERGPATQAAIDPDDIAIDSNGTLYIADFFNNSIRKVSNGIISTVAGTGTAGYAGDNSTVDSAVLDGPTAISVDAQGVIYFGDYYNNRIRKIDQKTGIITTFAGNGFFGSGGDNGPATQAPLLLPVSTAVEPDGNVLILMLQYLKRVTVADGKIHAVAGSDILGFAGDGGAVGSAQVAVPDYVAAAANGDILISDLGNYRVRRVRSSIINTVAGTAISDNIPATNAFLSRPEGVVPDGKGGFIISDTYNHRLRAVSNNTIAGFTGTGVPGSRAGQLAYPTGITRDSQGAVYIADWGNDRIMRYLSGGALSVIAGGSATGFSGDGGVALLAKLNGPSAVAVDSAGIVYIADTGNCRVRMVDTNGIITTLAGTGQCAYSGDNGPADKATLSPLDLALDGAGNLYVADDLNHRIRKINLSTKIISTIAGVGTPGFSGDGGPATLAQLTLPEGVAVDAAGNVYIADSGNSLVRMIRGNTIRTIAGTGDYHFDVESGPALGVSLDPVGISVDTDGTVYVTDELNDRVRKLTIAVPASLTINSGDGQSGAPGARVTFSAKVADASGTPVEGVTVNFSVTGGSAQLSAASSVTDAKGIATIQATLGTTAGAVKISASSSGLSPVTFTMTIVIPVPVGPQITQGGVVGAGLSVPAVTALSAGGIASAFGKAFGGGAVFQKVGTSDLVNGKVPINFRGICVDLSGTRALIFGASDTQVNFQVPLLNSGAVTVKVITNCGANNEAASAGVSVSIAAATPEFFYFSYSTDGHNPVAATDSISGAYLGTGAGFVPANPNQYVTVYGTGFGGTNPPVAPGDFPDQLAKVAGSVRVLLNGKQLPAANVLYAGVTPFSPGLYQLNLLLPDDTPDGDLPLVIEIAGVQSPPGAYLTVKK